MVMDVGVKLWHTKLIIINRFDYFLYALNRATSHPMIVTDNLNNTFAFILYYLICAKLARMKRCERLGENQNTGEARRKWKFETKTTCKPNAQNRRMLNFSAFSGYFT